MSRTRSGTLPSDRASDRPASDKRMSKEDGASYTRLRHLSAQERAAKATRDARARANLAAMLCELWGVDVADPDADDIALAWAASEFRDPVRRARSGWCVVNSALVVDRTGLTYRQLDHWCRMGWLRPRTDGGSGNARDFSLSEMLVAVAMARLVSAGLTPVAAHRVARGEQILAPGVVVLLDPDEVMVAS